MTSSFLLALSRGPCAVWSGRRRVVVTDADAVLAVAGRLVLVRVCVERTTRLSGSKVSERLRCGYCRVRRRPARASALSRPPGDDRLHLRFIRLSNAVGGRPRAASVAISVAPSARSRPPSSTMEMRSGLRPVDGGRDDVADGAHLSGFETAVHAQHDRGRRSVAFAREQRPFGNDEMDAGGLARGRWRGWCGRARPPAPAGG